MDHFLRRTYNGRVLGHHARAQAKNQHISGVLFFQRLLVEMATGSFQHTFKPRGLGPVRGIVRQFFSFNPIKLTIDPAHQTKAIRAGAFQTGLMVVGRADPASRASSIIFLRFMIIDEYSLTG